MKNLFLQGFRALLCLSTSAIYAQDTLKVNFNIGGRKCSNDTVLFTDLTYANKPIISRKWNFGDGQTSTSANPFHIYSNTGTYRISLVVQMQTGTTDSFVLNYLLKGKPEGQTSVHWPCTYPALTQFYFAPKNMAHYFTTWLFNDTVMPNTENRRSYNRTYLDTGKYSAAVFMYDSTTNCWDTSQLNFTVKQGLQYSLKFTPIRPCLMDSVLFSATLLSGQADTSATIQFGDGYFGKFPSAVHQYYAQITLTYNHAALYNLPGFCPTMYYGTITIYDFTHKKYFLPDTFKSGLNNYIRFTPSADSIKPLIEYGVTYDWTLFRSPSDSLNFWNTQTLVMPDTFTSGIRVRMNSTHSSGCTSSITRDFNYAWAGVPKIGKPIFKLYPNPVKDILYIESGMNVSLRAKVTDLSGKTISQFRLKAGLNSVPAPVSPGIYLLQIDGIRVQKFMVGN